MEENNKKVIVPTIVAVITLVLLTVGATYAYFKVATDNKFGTPKIEATTPSIGSVALSTGSNLIMNLTAEEMMEKDSDVTYYASPSGTTTEAHTERIGTATVTGNGSYTCTYTLTIDDNANSLYDVFQSGYANKSAGQVVLTVNGVAYDFNTAGLFPKEIEGTMTGLTASAPQYITAQLKMVNSKSIDQSNLANQNITLTFGVEDFSCTAEETDGEQTAVQYILANASDTELWDSTLEDDGYRYIGTNPDNYVCFGYSDAETDCDFTNADNTDKYAYRVIGIFEDSNGVEHVKLIKKEALNETVVWDEDEFSSRSWNESDLYNGINGSYFVNNTTYSYMQDESWSNKIATWDYTMTTTLDLTPWYDDEIAQNVYLHEMNRSTKTSTIGDWKTTSVKVSLMYVSDYLLSLGSSALEYTSESNKETLKTGWMHISNNDTSAPSSDEWTMIPDSGDSVYAWRVTSNGAVISLSHRDTLSARPVFHLTNDTTMTGEGTIESPFIVNK